MATLRSKSSLNQTFLRRGPRSKCDARAVPRAQQARAAHRAADASTRASPPGKARAMPTADTAAAPGAYASTGAGAAPDARNPAICAAS